MTFTVGSLFAGIGGFDLGFERSGFKTAWQVEIDPDCQKVLAKNFPHAERYSDIRECGAHNLNPVDVICGGFPCQDISHANTMGRKALEGDRSGLWFEQARIIRQLRPPFVLVENVYALLAPDRDKQRQVVKAAPIGRVLGDLAEIGYDAEWDCISAAAIGADHKRERVWIVAYPREKRWKGCILGAGILESAQKALAESCNEVPRGWRDLPAVVQRLQNHDGLSVGVVRRLVSPFGNAVMPQIPEAIARRIFEVLKQENQ